MLRIKPPCEQFEEVEKVVKSIYFVHLQLKTDGAFRTTGLNIIISNAYIILSNPQIAQKLSRFPIFLK